LWHTFYDIDQDHATCQALLSQALGSSGPHVSSPDHDDFFKHEATLTSLKGYRVRGSDTI
jgi:hypothetical protein